MSNKREIAPTDVNDKQRAESKSEQKQHGGKHDDKMIREIKVNYAGNETVAD